MAQLDWGTGIGLHFANNEEYYETLGYLAGKQECVKVYTHDNNKSGARSGQGKLHTHASKESLPDGLRRSFEESGDNRLSVSGYVRNLIENHGFTESYDPTDKSYTFYRFPDSVESVRETVPEAYLKDFDRGCDF